MRTVFRTPLRWFLLAALALASVAAAQDFGDSSIMMRARYPTPSTFGHGFNFCRALYTSSGEVREAGGMGWATDYPDADRNFSVRLAEMTKTRVTRIMARDGTKREPEFLVVQLTSDALFQCPYLHMEDVGWSDLTATEVEKLRAYLLKGGFLWVDDFWGERAWNNWVEELSRVLPPSEYPVVDIPATDQIFRTLFDIREVPQIPSIQYWRASGGGVSERGPDSADPHFRGIYNRYGNLMVVMTHNTDVSDAWEREGEDRRFFYSFSPTGYAFGVNVVLYALTH
ncbi:MAG: DUF4159 domain-containing protein [Vicinamibacterales bacterium]